MKINCKLISFKGKKEYENDFEFELEPSTAIATTEQENRSIVMIHGNAYTINIPFKELQKKKKDAKRDHS